MTDLFSAMDSRGGAADAVTGRAWLQAMLDVEAALARACAREDLIPASAAEAIATAARTDRFDYDVAVRGTGDHATPVVSLVHELRAAVGGEFAEHVHLGATSQDIVDTAAMLVAKRASSPILSDAREAADAAARLATEYRDQPVVGRTLMQQAVPTSFGLKAAVWLSGIDEAVAELRRVRSGVLAVQMGGAVGTRAPAIARLVAAELDLVEPTLPWHTVRTRPAALAAALGALTGVLGKVARDVALLGQNEIGEVREGGAGRGGSSAMSHKRNPVASIAVTSCAERAPGLVSTMFAVMPQELERAAGRWQAEWATLSDLLRLTGSAAAWGADLLTNLEVDADRMNENLARLAESGVVEAATPSENLGAAGELIDRALAVHRETGT